MSHSDNAAEVAEDYRHALEDLTMNSRYEITNLTVVARENTEHAFAISETLQEHIKKVGLTFFLPSPCRSRVAQVPRAFRSVAGFAFFSWKID
jgi:pre-mRNA cleavage complex 2 protein Pcf11